MLRGIEAGRNFATKILYFYEFFSKLHNVLPHISFLTASFKMMYLSQSKSFPEFSTWFS
jgi:hypothetical protein